MPLLSFLLFMQLMFALARGVIWLALATWRLLFLPMLFLAMRTMRRAARHSMQLLRERRLQRRLRRGRGRDAD